MLGYANGLSRFACALVSVSVTFSWPEFNHKGAVSFKRFDIEKLIRMRNLACQKWRQCFVTSQLWAHVPGGENNVCESLVDSLWCQGSILDENRALGVKQSEMYLNVVAKAQPGLR